MEGDTSLATPLPNTGQLKILKTDWESLKIYRPEVNTMSRAARDLQGFFFFFFSRDRQTNDCTTSSHPLGFISSERSYLDALLFDSPNRIQIKSPR